MTLWLTQRAAGWLTTPNSETRLTDKCRSLARAAISGEGWLTDLARDMSDLAKEGGDLFRCLPKRCRYREEAGQDQDRGEEAMPFRRGSIYRLSAVGIWSVGWALVSVWLFDPESHWVRGPIFFFDNRRAES